MFVYLQFWEMSSYLHVDSQESVGPLVVSSTLTILLYRTATLCVLPPYIRSLNMLPDLSKSVLSVFLIGDVHVSNLVVEQFLTSSYCYINGAGRNRSIIDAALPPSNVTGEIRQDSSSGASCSKAAWSDRLRRDKTSSAKWRWNWGSSLIIAGEMQQDQCEFVLLVT